MRVLVTCPELEKPGGVANYFQVLRRHFPSDVDYFTVGARQNEVGLLKKFLRFCKDSLTFAARLKRSRYDLVHLNPSFLPMALIRDGLLLLIAKSFGNKVIVFFRGWDHRWERIIYRFFPWLFRFIYFRANAFIVLSAEFRDWLQEMGYIKPVYIETTVVPNDIFTNTEGDYGMIKEEKPDNKINILFLTHIERSKGIYETIDAYQILKNSYPHLMLTVAGNGSETTQVASYIEKRGIHDANLIGYVTGKAKHKAFSEGDIYIFPSYSEGMPNSVLEAMAYGLPIVTTAVGGLRDFFKNGEMGFIIESKDSAMFAELIEMLINNPQTRKRMGCYNRQYAQEHFSASKVMERLTNIYGSVS